MKSWIRRLLWPLKWLLALWLLFEEWGWVPLQALLARMGRWPGLRWLEGAIHQLPPYAALVLLCVPAVLLLPVKLLALWAVGKGHVLTGLVVIVLAKVAGTALLARLFTLTQPRLMTLPWFVRLYTRWTGWKTRLLDWVRSSAAWRSAQTFKVVCKRWWRRRWPKK